MTILLCYFFLLFHGGLNTLIVSFSLVGINYEKCWRIDGKALCVLLLLLQALSATDLSLVLFVCETIDSQQVFGQHPCPLSQPVLLSLIQQLSSNLATRTELKIR